MGRLVDHIKSNLYDFERAYNKSPEKIFISTPLLAELWSELTLVNLHRDGFYTTCCGIRVEEFRSDKMEYYFAESGYEIKF
jgi:hypothetical protein